MTDPRMLDKVERIIEAYEAKPTALIMILQEVQAEYRHLPREAMEIVGRRMDLALSQIYGVATRAWSRRISSLTRSAAWSERWRRSIP